MTDHYRLLAEKLQRGTLNEKEELEVYNIHFRYLKALFWFSDLDRATRNWMALRQRVEHRKRAEFMRKSRLLEFGISW